MNIFRSKVPIIAGSSTSISPEARVKIDQMVAQLNGRLSESTYFCGSEVTLADLTILGSVTFLIVNYHVDNFKVLL